MEAILNFIQNSWHWILIAIAALIIVIKFIPRYKIAPPDTALIISGLILYLVYGVGARDLGERLAIREKRRKRIEKIKGKLGIAHAAAEGMPKEEQETAA